MVSAEVYDELCALSNGRVIAADRLIEKLPIHSPLRSLPKEEICQSYMAPNACLHSNTTNNMAGIGNHMMSVTRTQNMLFIALQSAAFTMKQRHVRAYHSHGHTSKC